MIAFQHGHFKSNVLVILDTNKNKKWFLDVVKNVKRPLFDFPGARQAFTCLGGRISGWLPSPLQFFDHSSLFQPRVYFNLLFSFSSKLAILLTWFQWASLLESFPKLITPQTQVQVYTYITRNKQQG
jgi:hypothetical protein